MYSFFLNLHIKWMWFSLWRNNDSYWFRRADNTLVWGMSPFIFLMIVMPLFINPPNQPSIGSFKILMIGIFFIVFALYFLKRGISLFRNLKKSFQANFDEHPEWNDHILTLKIEYEKKHFQKKLRNTSKIKDKKRL